MNVEFEGVSFSYRRNVVLREVSWQLGGGVTGLLGPNGAGKTTLLSLLVMLLRPKQGRVLVGGCDLAVSSDRRDARRLIGFIPQRFTIAPEMRVRDVVAYTGWVHGLAGRDCMAAAERALDEVGLGDRGRDRVRTLSGGQRQRVGVATALTHDPSVLVLDEPTVGLDPAQRLRFRELIAVLGTQRTVVLSSHMLEDIEHLCQTVGVLAEGRLVFSGTIGDLTSRIAETDHQSGMGSRFERAYTALITKMSDQG